MQALQTFNFKELPVRTVEIENEPYFVGKDIAEILGYARADNAIRNHVDSEDKLTHQFSASGQNRNMIIINESGLYSLIFDASKQSKNEKIRETARKFKRWVTSDVLPAIRKHGIYATDNVIEQTLKDPDYIITVLTEYKKEKEQNLLLQQEIGEEHMGKSYTESDTIAIVRSDGREDTVLQTRWTQKGRLKIHEIMTEFGYEANVTA
ncbi:BRO family protein [Staphylococcus aureus]|uniref:BRO family protein n=1 Tax=Staphylococcus aureus TaxID=1280 RepID=UPI001C1F3051|nr:BRO family protein [Staphylococcus aureus]MBU7361320.1 phage antirepressor KilAC domain-containing protein [Staphylococcus aureus]MBU7367151.1 phage antirepressor KilAC domain-containing protein [Staphylococcus aureus]MBU7392393.1 phage antirepressor KilAC domain-containing protein [Staphylococcus aureus]MBU7400343.1 phage antirepressor KilAC domain-containing protein [Staphylococcus aureus]